MVTSAFLVRPSLGDLFRSDVASYGIRVRDEMRALMTGAVQSFTVPGGGESGNEPFSDGFFWDDSTGFLDD